MWKNARTIYGTLKTSLPHKGLTETPSTIEDARDETGDKTKMRIRTLMAALAALIVEGTLMCPPPRRPRNNQPDPENRNNPRGYDPSQVCVTLWDSLRALDLGNTATYAEVKAQYRSMARIYHPDQHRPESTGMSNEQAKQFFQMINNAHEFLKSRM